MDGVQPRRLRSLAFPSVVLCTLLSAACLYASGQKSAAPAKPATVLTLTGSAAIHKIIALQRKGKLSTYSAACLDQHLYLGTTAGIVELDEHGLLRLMNAGESVWADPANHAIWALDEKRSRLLRRRKDQWHSFSLPDTNRLNRGDFLRGPSLAGNENGLWMAWGGVIWRWDGTAEQWKPITDPESRLAVAAIPLGTTPLILRGLPPLDRETHDLQRGTDEIFDSEAPDRQIRNPIGPFYALSWASTSDAAYICTSAQKILKITRTTIVPFDAPGQCLAVSGDAISGLIASFKDLGVFQYARAQGWQRLATAPPVTGHFKAVVASNGAQVAFGVAPDELIVRDGKDSVKFRHDMQGNLWFSKSDALLPIEAH